MRRLAAAVGCGCLAASGWAQNLQVVAPAAGDVWTFGSTQQIKWRARNIAGFPPEIFGTITLERGGRQVAVISTKASLVTRVFVGRGPALGDFWDYRINWQVQRSGSPNFVAAQDYRVRLRPDPADPSYPEAVSAPFAIAVLTATDQPGNQMVIKKGDCVISAFRVVARPNDPAHVAIRVEVQNLRYASSAGLQLRLIKNHVQFKFVRIPEMKQRTRWHLDLIDDAPEPFHTSTYIAILSTGDPISEPASELDRKQAEYRRAGVLHGGS